VGESDCRPAAFFAPILEVGALGRGDWANSWTAISEKTIGEDMRRKNKGTGILQG
jgi:hypothetical protein